MQTKNNPSFWEKLKHIFPIVVMDSCCFIFAIWLSFGLRLNDFWSKPLIHNWLLFPVILIIGIPLLYFCNVYRSNLRYAGFALVKKIAFSVALLLMTVLSLWGLGFFNDVFLIPRTCWFIIYVLSIGFLASYRMVVRDYLRKRHLKNIKRKYVLIYGAGSAGIQLFRAMKENHEIKIVGFLDDSHTLIGQDIDGIRIYAPDQLQKLIEKHKISSILLAIPSISQYRKRELINWLTQFSLEVLSMPSLVELATGARKVDDLRRIAIEDILGRDAIAPNESLLARCIKAKNVLVTGAGGSIGSELCRQILSQQPTCLILVENNEFFLYQIESELRRIAKERDLTTEIIPILGSILRKNKMRTVMTRFKIQTVYHAAAYKHVPIVERNIIEGVQNNIFGTLSVALAAKFAGVETFVLISTDKAVRPTNIMGATKRFAELILQAMAKTPTLSWQDKTYEDHRTVFCMVRFGNVLASSGSVVPLFTSQILAGGPVTVTHPEMIRYFMTIPEAAQLVLQAGSLSTGGEVFLLDMGEPVKIYDLARRMIELSGFKVLDKDQPDGDIEIVFSGLRPGEKLYEELLIGDQPLPTNHEMIFSANEGFYDWDELQFYLTALDSASRDNNYQAIRDILLKSVEGYHPDTELCDWLLEEA